MRLRHSKKRLDFNESVQIRCVPTGITQHWASCMKRNSIYKMPSWPIRMQWMLLKRDQSRFFSVWSIGPFLEFSLISNSLFIKARCKLADANAACGRYANASHLYKDLLDVIPDEVAWHYKLYEIAFSFWLCSLMLQVSLRDDAYESREILPSISFMGSTEC
jgi:hypothetical protein